MPRMAERIAGSFDKRLSRPDTLEIHVRRPSQSIDKTFKVAPNAPLDRTLSVSSTGSRKVKRISLVENEDGELEVSEDFVDIIQEANMDGVRHLRSQNKWTKFLWTFVIVVFCLLALYQIYSQILLYSKHPVATNIDAEYPSSIAFPTVAICNNNQYRLTYITSARLLNRRPKMDRTMKSVKDNSSVFDKVLQNAWDMDAVKFLRNAAHWKSRMILDCTWPNGTSCRPSDFSAVWTMTGLCWAINTDPRNPVQVTGSGAGHGLRLLLNVESYERVDACTPHFRTKSLPGLKILIYNQTDIPESSLNGVNVPPGYWMDVPFKMQHRHKLPGSSCIEETSEHLEASHEDFFSDQNIRTCAIQKYISSIEKQCDCSMRRAFTNPKVDPKYPFCNVDDYFGCVQRVIQKLRESGKTARCLPPCESIDYTAWQDMNRLPQNIMPPVIDEMEGEDESDVEEEDIDDEVFVQSGASRVKHDEDEVFMCSESAQLDEKAVNRIKREAHRAYEKQSRYQEDIHLRTKRLIEKVKVAMNRLKQRGWGWHAGTFESVYERLNKTCKCYREIEEQHPEIAALLSTSPITGEEKRAQQIHYLVDSSSHSRDPTRYKTIGDVKAVYGDKVETVLKDIQTIMEMSDKMRKLFDIASFHVDMDVDVGRMDRIVQLMTQYESGSLQRRAWAEKMETRQMRHFFEEEFYDAWYQPIYTDLQQTLQKSITEIGNNWNKMEDLITNGTAQKIGAYLFFGDATKESKDKIEGYLTDTHSCIVGEMNQTTTQLLYSFKKMFKELQAAYNNLFKKELPGYLENFDFGQKFESDNFAMVNIYLHKMHLEHWRQDRTYTFWSLACDVGGALGLFLGASLLTIIELIYLCFHYGLCREGMHKVKHSQVVRRIMGDNSITKKPKNSMRGSMADRSSYDPTDVKDLIDRSSKTSARTPGEYNQDHPKKTSLWSNPLTDFDYESLQQNDRIEDSDMEDYLTMDDVSDMRALTPPKFSTIQEVDTPPDYSSSPVRESDAGYGSTFDRERSGITDEEQPSPARPRKITVSVTPPENLPAPGRPMERGSSSSSSTPSTSSQKHPSRIPTVQVPPSGPGSPTVPYSPTRVQYSPGDLSPTVPESIPTPQTTSFEGDSNSESTSAPQPLLFAKAPPKEESIV